jgi:hypothetical protein
MDAPYTVLLIAAMLSPIFAIGFATYYYRLFRRAPEPKLAVPAVAFIAILLISALISYFLGIGIGVEVACSSASSGNLCGLFGYFVLGPLFSSLSIILVAKFWSTYARKARQT